MMQKIWSNWFIGEEVIGIYCGVKFTGILTENTRPTSDYKNIILHVKLDEPIVVFGITRHSLEVYTNGTDYVYPKGLMEKIA